MEPSPTEPPAAERQTDLVVPVAAIAGVVAVVVYAELPPAQTVLACLAVAALIALIAWPRACLLAAVSAGITGALFGGAAYMGFQVMVFVPEFLDPVEVYIALAWTLLLAAVARPRDWRELYLGIRRPIASVAGVTARAWLPTALTAVAGAAAVLGWVVGVSIFPAFGELLDGDLPGLAWHVAAHLAVIAVAVPIRWRLGGGAASFADADPEPEITTRDN